MKQELQRTAWWAGIYPLLLAVLMGMGWMDGSWFHLLQGVMPEADLGAAAREVSDMLLWLLALAMFAGGIAAWLWEGSARLLCIGSMCVLCLLLLVPALAGAVPGVADYLADGGVLLRTGIHLAALAMAVVALRRALS